MNKSNHVAVIILAAGLGKRMKSDIPKIMHPLAGKKIIDYPLDLAKKISKQTVLVLGHKAEVIQEYVKDHTSLTTVIQQPQLGTGHAVSMCEPYLKAFEGTTIVLYGDVPLLKEETINNALNKFSKEKMDLLVLTFHTENPKGYGRIVKGSDNKLLQIVEDKDCSSAQTAINEVNSGIIIADNKLLFDGVAQLSNNNEQGEYYLTDVVAFSVKKGKKVGTLLVNQQEVLGINDRYQLSNLERIFMKENLKKYMDAGVTLINPDSIYIEEGVEIDNDVTIYPGCFIRGKTKIGKGTKIFPNCMIENTLVGNNVEIKFCSCLSDAVVKDGAQIGPYARLRPDAIIEKNAHIGNFVEVKKSNIGEGSKVNHLTYIGDSDIGKHCNIGAGTITCNYDGKKKHKTTLGDNVFIGSNNTLCAPIEIASNNYTAAGSTLTKSVKEEGALIIGRARQEVKLGWKNKRGM